MSRVSRLRALCISHICCAHVRTATLYIYSVSLVLHMCGSYETVGTVVVAQGLRHGMKWKLDWLCIWRRLGLQSRCAQCRPGGLQRQLQALQLLQNLCPLGGC